MSSPKGGSALARVMHAGAVSCHRQKIHRSLWEWYDLYTAIWCLTYLVTLGSRLKETSVSEMHHHSVAPSPIPVPLAPKHQLIYSGTECPQEVRRILKAWSTRTNEPSFEAVPTNESFHLP